MGTTSIKDKKTLDKIDKIVGKNRVSHIFLTHPDDDHYNYITEFMKGKKYHNVHFGGNLNLWGKGQNSEKTVLDIVKRIELNKNPRDFSYSEYTDESFKERNEKGEVVRKSQIVHLCNRKLQMEILSGGYGIPGSHTTFTEKDKKNYDKNLASLVMRLSGKNLKSMLFMGDFTGDNAVNVLDKLLLQKPTFLKADVWVLPHHGSAMMKFEDKTDDQRATIYKKLAKAGNIILKQYLYAYNNLLLFQSVLRKS